MKPSHAGGVLVLLAIPLAALVLIGRVGANQPAAPPAAEPPTAWSAIGVVVTANAGKVPATGEQLAAALARIGRFAQLPVPFSAVRLESGLANPRVVITPAVAGLSTVAPNFPNLDGRLFLAANMDRGPDPRVTSVEFISWNARTKRFDFGVIENMGGAGPPHLRVVDGGRCFSCHKNRGPILGLDPWSNTAHDDFVRTAMANKLRLTLPGQQPTLAAIALNPVLPRDRIDGMTLARPEGPEVDFGVRLGSGLRLNRDVFRAMTRTPGGGKALVALITPVVDGSPIDPRHGTWQQPVDSAMAPSMGKFAADWVALQKAWNAGILADFTPAGVSSGGSPQSASASALGARTPTAGASRWGGGTGTRPTTTPTVPPNSPAAKQAEAQRQMREAVAAERKALSVDRVTRYDAARAQGDPGLPSVAQPSNPRAFLQLPIHPPARASEVVNPTMFASAVGLTEGDRRFLANALADAVKQVRKPGMTLTAATVARQVFEGTHFADVRAGGPLPDRDEFKDRFAAGLDAVLRTNHGLLVGFAPDRATYALLPRLDPSAEDREADAVPTTACLRCHDVRGPVKAPGFEPIPTLAFDPFDRHGREAWVAATPDRKARRQVLERMVKRMFEDRDMPPEDAAEHARFRVGGAAAFEEARLFLDAELKKAKPK